MREALEASVAPEWPFPRVETSVLGQVVLVLEALVAFSAGVRPLIWMENVLREFLWLFTKVFNSSHLSGRTCASGGCFSW